MSDLIDRQAAIDHWRLIIDATNTDSRYNMGFVDGLEFCISHLSTMPSAQPEPKWIPCSERLPDEEIDVLVTRTFLGCKDGGHGNISPNTYVEVAQYFNGEWIALSDEYKVAISRHTDPVAWMPLPTPYKEENK